MSMELEPGDATPRVGAVIVAACLVTIAIAFYGMQALWEAVEWVQEPYWDEVSPGRDRFWYTNGLGMATCIAIALAWWPRFRVSKLLRVAVILPVLHIGTIVVAAHVWSIFDADALAKINRLDIANYFNHPAVPLPDGGTLAVGFAALVLVAIAIKRRHGEWAHAAMMLALSNLLLVGLSLPLVSRLAVRIHDSDWWRDDVTREWDADTIASMATIPAALISIAFVAIVFRAPGLFERLRRSIRIVTVAALILASVLAASLPDKSWLVYLESSYLVMGAVVLAVAALLLLIAATGMRSLRSRWRSRKRTYRTGVIAGDEHGEVARYEITSWLRGPQLTTRPFVVTTPEGDVPIAGATLIAPLPPTTTLLDVGDHVGVLSAGDRVVIATRSTVGHGHPFRASDAIEVSHVYVADAPAHRFSDLVLVAWRPAVAYLAIIVAVALPYLTIFLD
ncbi:MAG TPA: hypothetical protein VIV11_01880 [Kofleriaceae bacterium]